MGPAHFPGALQITNVPSTSRQVWPAVSPDGRFIASWYKENRQSRWKAALIAFGLSTPIKTFDISVPNQALRWQPDGSAITYIKTVDGVSNIWSQPVDGGPPKQLTNFVSESIQNFASWKDGTLVSTRHSMTRNRVLIRNFRQ